MNNIKTEQFHITQKFLYLLQELLYIIMSKVTDLQNVTRLHDEYSTQLNGLFGSFDISVKNTRLMHVLVCFYASL